ncbi:MAG: hypothetical protein AAF564_16140 [Bacteroidota bacterium]
MQEAGSPSRPELTEADYNSPFRHDTTSASLLYAVLFILFFTCVFIAVGIAMVV